MSRARTLGAVLYEGFELLDLYGPLEMFGSVGPELALVTVAETAGPVKSGVKSAPGPETLARFDFASAPKLDLLLLPGGVGTLAQLGNQALLGFLRERSREAEATLSVCTGSALLAKAGLLDGRRATSNKLWFDVARSQGERVHWVEKARWVEDGPFVTSSGVSAGIDMSLAVIAKLWGRERAEGIAIANEYEWHADPARDPFHRYLNQGAARLAGGGA